MPHFQVPQLTKNSIWKKPGIKKKKSVCHLCLHYRVNCSGDGNSRLLSSCFTEEFHQYLLQQRSIPSPGEILAFTVVL